MTLRACVMCCICLATLLVPYCEISAQIPQKMNYQVMLTDDMDQPLADQTVEMVFTIYDAETGGTPLWTETQNPTSNYIGVVSVMLGSVNPIDCSFDAPRWLEIEVDGQVLTPRRELVTAPYAGRAANADNSDRLGDIDAAEYALLDDLGSLGDGHSLDADDGTPADALYVDSTGQVGVGTSSPAADLDVPGDVRIGSTGPTGGLTVGGGATDGYASLSSEGPEGPRLVLYGGSDNQIASLGSVPNPAGGELLLYRNAAQEVGVELTANWYGSQDARLYMGGNTDIFEVNLNWGTSDGKVNMPDGSVSASETAHEPGVGSIQAGGDLNISSGSVTTIASRTINCPTSGYVFVMGTAEAQMYLYDSNGIEVTFGISESINAWSGAAQETKIRIPGALPGATYFTQACAQGLFEVGAGNNTFHMNALESKGDITVRARQLSVMFFPTAYGSVDTTD